MKKQIHGFVFETAVDNLPDVLCVIDKDGAVRFLNTAAFDFLGMTAEQAIGRPLAEICPAAIVQKVQDLMALAIKDGVAPEAEVSGLLLDGTAYTSHVRAVPVLENGAVSHVLLVSHDISERTEAEQQRDSYFDRINVLLQISLNLLDVDNVDSLLEGVVEAAQRLTNARLAMASQLSKDGEWILGPCRSSDGVPPCLLPDRFIKTRSGFSLNMLVNELTMRLTDEQMRAHPKWRGLPKGHVPLRGILASRMVDRNGRVKGLIMLSDKEEGEFTVEDETLIRHLGALASLALQHIEAREQIEVRARQAEEMTKTLEKTAADLEQSNKDLEQFAYTASHDLQEPLRMITGFLGLIRQQCAGRVDRNADEYIAYAIDGANRMQNLISGLLAYSRIGSMGEPFTEIDLEAVVDRALTVLGAPLFQSGAIIKRDPLPAVFADEMQMVQLYQNLLANSIKFRSDRKLELHIGARCENEQWLLWVRDNGMGFPQSKAERVFLIFHRLHANAPQEGTGIGLAFCKRVVERHSGRIWAESEPGKGTTFYFTINTPGAI